ncbi:hypothetical protein JOM56_004488 [Amanita muscaria]
MRLDPLKARSLALFVVYSTQLECKFFNLSLLLSCWDWHCPVHSHVSSMSKSALIRLFIRFSSQQHGGETLSHSPSNLLRRSASVTQSTFCQPCEHLRTRNSFDSGASELSGGTFTVAVPDARPIYAFSSVGDDCHKGMAFAVNVDQEKYNEFQRRALNQVQGHCWYGTHLCYSEGRPHSYLLLSLIRCG